MNEPGTVAGEGGVQRVSLLHWGGRGGRDGGMKVLLLPQCSFLFSLEREERSVCLSGHRGLVRVPFSGSPLVSVPVS